MSRDLAGTDRGEPVVSVDWATHGARCAFGQPPDAYQVLARLLEERAERWTVWQQYDLTHAVVTPRPWVILRVARTAGDAAP